MGLNHSSENYELMPDIDADIERINEQIMRLEEEKKQLVEQQDRPETWKEKIGIDKMMNVANWIIERIRKVNNDDNFRDNFPFGMIRNDRGEIDFCCFGLIILGYLLVICGFFWMIWICDNPQMKIFAMQNRNELTIFFIKIIYCLKSICTILVLMMDILFCCRMIDHENHNSLLRQNHLEKRDFNSPLRDLDCCCDLRDLDDLDCNFCWIWIPMIQMVIFFLIYRLVIILICIIVLMIFFLICGIGIGLMTIIRIPCFLCNCCNCLRRWKIRKIEGELRALNDKKKKLMIEQVVQSSKGFKIPGEAMGLNCNYRQEKFYFC